MPKVNQIRVGDVTKLVQLIEGTIAPSFDAEDCKDPAYQDNSQKTIYKVKVNKMVGEMPAFHWKTH